MNLGNKLKKKLNIISGVNKNFLEEFYLIILESINVEITKILLILTFKCLEEDLVALAALEACKVVTIRNHKKRK